MKKQREHRIFILLTRSKTMVSKTIGLLTGDEYTHAAIAFDGELRTLCSFSRHFKRLPLPAGLVYEPLSVERFGDVPCMLCAVTVPERAYRQARSMTRNMLLRRKEYSYSIKGLAMCRIGIPEKRPMKYFCSQFVAEVLESSGAVRLPKEPTLMRPQDIASLPELECLYRGELGGLLEVIDSDRELTSYPRYARI